VAAGVCSTPRKLCNEFSGRFLLAAGKAVRLYCTGLSRGYFIAQAQPVSTTILNAKKMTNDSEANDPMIRSKMTT